MRTPPDWPLTHASFFSGAGGLDLGLERAGWRTVSFSEIDPYACAVLRERWPGVPNLGDIVRLAEPGGRTDAGQVGGDGTSNSQSNRGRDDWQHATLWSGGFPCQDLSVAGKRRGLAGARSGLAWAFLDLVGRHRPRWVLLENVPGLLSSNGGRDFGALLGALGEFGYGWAYRVLDARYFGVAQRRRRVFVVAGPDADSAAAVLFEQPSGGGDSAAGAETGTGTAARPGYGIAHALTVSHTRSGRYDPDGETYVVGAPTDAGRVRAADGLAGRLDDRRELVQSLLAKGNSSHAEDLDTYVVAPTLRVGAATPAAGGPGDTVPIVVAHSVRPRSGMPQGWNQTLPVGEPAAARADDLLPLGLDSHRYRCCGNGVVANVSEWVGRRLAAVEQERAA